MHYDVTNPSNHNAVKFQFKCNVNNIVTRDNANGLSTDRSAWHKNTQDNIYVYINNLDMLLAEIYIPSYALLCHDVLCDASAHKLDIDQLCSDILISCLNAGKESIRSRKKFKHWLQDGRNM